MAGLLMATEWRYRLILIVHVNANTLVNRQAFAGAFVNNGSGETLTNEMKMFQNARRLALAATPTIHRAYGISVPIKATMRDALLAVIAQVDAPLSAAQKSVYYGVANVDGAMFQGHSYAEDQCFYVSRASDAALLGTVIRARDILQLLGLVRLVEDE
jgi:hypothetical protein